jgi:hypothetical protein
MNPLHVLALRERTNGWLEFKLTGKEFADLEQVTLALDHQGSPTSLFGLKARE